MPRLSVNRLMNDLFAVLAAVAGASGSGFALNAIPGVKEWPTWGKVGTQFAAGWFLREAFARRYPLVKELGFGAMVAAGISATQELTKQQALAGRQPRRLTDAEFRALISGGRNGVRVNGPVNNMGYNGVKMNGPVNNMSGGYGNAMMGHFMT